MTTQPFADQTIVRAPLPIWRATPAQHIITLLAGFWLMIGIFVDGWAHNNLGDLETFFTPWHAVFYSGFLANAGWMTWLGLRGYRSGRRGLALVPDGYQMGALGVGIFALGGLGDMTWHLIFGIEKGIDALLSPTHLLLFLGAELLVLTPLIALWRAPTTRRVRAGLGWTAVCSMTLALSFASFMHMYAWALASLPDAYTYMGQRSLLTSTLVTALMLIAPVLLLLRRWQTPFGAVTLMYTLNTALMLFMTGATAALPQLLVLALGAGLIADGLILWLRPSPGRPWAYRGLAAALPLLIWVPFFAVSAARLGASLELWTGACVMAALGGLALSALIVPPAVPAEALE
jgi:hypothetical protein